MNNLLESFFPNSDGRAWWRQTSHRETLAYLVWQVMSFALPILVLGIAARRVTPTTFGVLAFAQGVAAILMKIAEFGYNIVGPRAVAVSHDDSAALKRIVSGIMIARIPVAFLLIVVSVVVGLTAPYFRGSPAMPAAALISALWSCFQVMWYYQGSGQYRIGVAYETTGRVIAVLLMFFLLRTDSDAWMAIGFLAIGAMAAQLGLILRIRHYFDMREGLQTAAFWFRSGLHTFLYRFVESFYSNAATLILSFFVVPAFLGNFSIAEKVTRASVRITYFIYGADYPKFARLFRDDQAAARQAVLRVLVLLVGIALAGAAIEALCAPLIVRTLMGRTPAEAVTLLRLMALVILPASITMYVCEAVVPSAHKSPTLMALVYVVGCAALGVSFLFLRHAAIGPIYLLPIGIGELCMFLSSIYLLTRILSVDREVDDLVELEEATDSYGPPEAPDI